MVQVVIETPQVLVVDKPSGMLSIPGRFGDADPRPDVKRHLERTRGEQMWTVHRLDFEVSGLLLFARNADAHRIANRLFERRQIRKTYGAWTEGERPAETEFLWKSQLLRGKKRAYESPRGKLAVTRARFEGTRAWQGQTVCVWSLAPETGRPHQLRVHLAGKGFPIVGDALYGATLPFAPDAIALRAVALEVLDEEAAAALELPGRIEAGGLEGVAP